MDKYEWQHNGRTCFVAREGRRAVLAVPTIGDRREEIAAAEILRLAEAADAEMERVKACEHIAEGEVGWDSLRNLCPSTAAVAELREDRDALAITVEEGREIEFEITMALAVLAGESLIPCGDGKTCPGHFGPKTMEAFTSALSAWRALQEGNRQATERIREMEDRLENARQHTRYLGRTQEEQEELMGEARLGSELMGILQEHAEREGVRTGEHYADTLKRLIEEHQTLSNTRDLYRATLAPLERDQRDGESLENTAARIVRERDAYLKDRESAMSEARKAGAAADAALRGRDAWRSFAQKMHLQRDAAHRENRELKHALEIDAERWEDIAAILERGDTYANAGFFRASARRCRAAAAGLDYHFDTDAPWQPQPAK
jgi:hypothetical protein